MHNNQTTMKESPIYSEFSGDDDFEELIEFYVSSKEDKKAELNRLFLSGDYHQLAEVAHQMKGSAGGYGFSSLTSLAAQLEEGCRLKDKDVVTAKVAAVLDQLDRICV